MYSKEDILNALKDKSKLVTYDDALVFRDSDLTLDYVTGQGVWCDDWNEINYSVIRIFKEV